MEEPQGVQEVQSNQIHCPPKSRRCTKALLMQVLCKKAGIEMTNLKELIKEVERLLSIDGSISSFSYQTLKGIHQTVEAVDELRSYKKKSIKVLYHSSLYHSRVEDYKDWQKLKKLLEIKD